jgi:DNA-directed RNA polymerase specialized sigma24 family protein
MDPSVEQQLAKLLKGEREAMAWLYDTFAPRLFRRLRQRYAYPGGPDAEDLLHDAFIALLQHDFRLLRRFHERPASEQTAATLERFLWDQACGVASNHRRTMARRPIEALPPTVELVQAPASEQALVDRDRLARLDACLEAGKTRVYLYYKLRYHDGLSPEEITRATGWSRKATYKLKEALNKALEQCVDQIDQA